MVNQQGKALASRIISCQLMLTMLISMICMLTLSGKAAKSACLGGLVCIIPNWYFAKKVFEQTGARAARQIVNNFYKGEGLKIILSILLFTLVLKFFNITPLIFFIVYLVVQMTAWFAPLMLTGNKYRPKSD